MSVSPVCSNGGGHQEAYRAEGGQRGALHRPTQHSQARLEVSITVSRYASLEVRDGVSITVSRYASLEVSDRVSITVSHYVSLEVRDGVSVPQLAAKQDYVKHDRVSPIVSRYASLEVRDGVSVRVSRGLH